MRPTYIAQTTLPNCLLTTKNRQKQSNLMFLSYRSQIGDWRPLKIHRLGTQGARDINLVPKEPPIFWPIFSHRDLVLVLYQKIDLNE